MVTLEAEAAEAARALDKALAALPNIPVADVPDGEDETANVELKRWGTPRAFDFVPRDHADLGPALGLDFEGGALISGARFAALRGQTARLHRARHAGSSSSSVIVVPFPFGDAPQRRLRRTGTPPSRAPGRRRPARGGDGDACIDRCTQGCSFCAGRRHAPPRRPGVMVPTQGGRLAFAH